MFLPCARAAAETIDCFVELPDYLVFRAVELCWWLNRSSVAALACRKAVEMSPALTIHLLDSDIVSRSLRTLKLGHKRSVLKRKCRRCP